MSFTFCQLGQTLKPRVGKGVGRQVLGTVDEMYIVVKFSEGQSDKIRNTAYLIAVMSFVEFYTKEIIAKMSKEICTRLFITTLFRRVKS